MDCPALLAHLRASVASFEAVLADGDLDAAVPSCPGWDLRALAWHLGGVHRWARFAVVEGRPGDEGSGGPQERDALRQWFSEGASELVATLEDTDPSAPVWGFGPKPSTAAFWFRRQAHETAMHTWDAQLSQASQTSLAWTPAPLDLELAADGIDEVVRMFFPRQVRLARIPALTRSLALETPQARWVLAGDGLAPDPGDAEATVRGSASDLLLLLWHRLDLDAPELTLDGDEPAARAVLSASVTP